MKNWSAYIRATSSSRLFSAERADRLVDVLYEYGAAVGSSGDGAWVSVQLSLEAADLDGAFVRATGILKKALVEIGVHDAVVDSAQLMTQEDFEKELSRPVYPELVGIHEIAKLLGVTRQRASALAASPQFPRPLARLAAGPVWPRPWITRFLQEWDRRPVRKGYKMQTVDRMGRTAMLYERAE